MGIFNSSSKISKSNKIVSNKKSLENDTYKNSQIKNNVDDTNIKSIFFDNTFNTQNIEDKTERNDQLIIIKTCNTCTESDYKKEDSKQKSNVKCLKEIKLDVIKENQRYDNNNTYSKESIITNKEKIQNKSKINPPKHEIIVNNIGFIERNNTQNLNLNQNNHKISNSISDTILPFHDIKASINDAYLLNSIVFEESMIKNVKNECNNKNKLFLFNQKN